MLTIFLLLFSNFSKISAVICPAGGVYNSDSNKCYFYYDQPAIFLAAESTCGSIGGNLAEPKDGFENILVAGIVSNLTHGGASFPYWIGASILMAPRWTWTTKDTILYTNWAAGNPTDPSIFQCASVQVDTYLWNKELCSSARPFVCSSNPIPEPVPTACDLGYSQYENQCFKLFNHFTTLMNYYESLAFCRLRENATLPKIPSQGVQDFLFNIVSKEGKEVWIGLGCWGTGPVDCWWLDGTQPTYTTYFSESPRAGRPLLMSLAAGQWYSEDAFRPLSTAVICQKPAREVLRRSFGVMTIKPLHTVSLFRNP